MPTNCRPQATGRIARALTTLLFAFIALTGCSNDSGPNIPSDGSTLPVGSTTRTSTPTSTGNRAPVVSGVPPATATLREPYVFVPNASDPDNDRLVFGIANMPAWMSFNVQTGQLFGVASDAAVGVHENVTISVTDGMTISSLPPFSITVKSTTASGSAKLRWVAPTKTANDKPITNLAGFRVYYGLIQPQFERVLDVPDASATQVTIGNLGPGTWYFAITAYTRGKQESERSPVVLKSI